MTTTWPLTGFTVRSVSTDDTTLSVAVGGGPALVLLHGGLQTGRAWRHVVLALARTHTVVVPDLRGTGVSARPGAGYDKQNRPGTCAACSRRSTSRGPPPWSATTSEPWSPSPGHSSSPARCPRSSCSPRC